MGHNPDMSFTEHLVQAWYKDHLLLRFLRPLEWLYRSLLRRRRMAFLSGKKAIYKAPVPVVVVGNITVGGTGKTPMVLWLIEFFQARQWRVGVVSRGYGAHPPCLPWLVEAQHSAVVAGDEPLLIKLRTGVPVVIDPDRTRAVCRLLQEHTIDVVLCDDGLQHYALARDLELVVIDATRGLGNVRCLPAGPLREPAERLDTVDAILINGGVQETAPRYAMQLVPTALVHVQSGVVQPLDFFPKGQQVHALAGIGNPQRFFHTLQKLHWQAIEHVFADHASYSLDQLHFVPKVPLIMTEKDAVKCRAFAQDDWWYLKVEATLPVAFEHWLAARIACWPVSDQP